MTIQAKHFDVRLNQWIYVDGNQNNQDSILQEKISNTLLERFLPGKNFSFGHMDKDVSDEQLGNHPDADKLLLSSKTRLLYGPSECLDIIDQICPDRKDRGAYGSVFLGGCRTALDVELNVLVIDDANGNNGGIINNDQAYRLTGDCYGQIADDVYRQLTGHEDGDKYRVIQHRFGWTPENGNDDSFRFGKGTFRPANLNETLNYTGSDKPKIDLIIPLSSFKGTDKDNPNGPTKPQIQPGLYRQKVWIGEKSQSELGKTAISQVLASFPQGMKDFTEKVELEAVKLAEAEKDPRKLAELYCEKYEKRKDYLENEVNNLEDEISEEFDEDKQNNLIKLRERLDNDSFIYKVIKADLAGDGQLLETEKVKNELTKFVQGEWRDIAIGKKLQFERALVIPSKELSNGEIFIPKYNEGEEVLNFRSPFLNSNGMCVSTNKTVEDALGPDGKTLEGIIVVSDETSERIYKRLSKQIEEILPNAIAQGVKSDGIEKYLNRGDYDKLKTPDKIEFTDKFNQYVKTLNEAGFDIEILPYESEQERQARDYDGDCIGFERAGKYPNLTAEAIHRNLPENAYAPTVKLKKASFFNEAGEQPSFEAIAKHMSDGISVGIINNHLTSIEALESEMEVIKQYGDSNMQILYVGEVAKHYSGLLKGENPEKENTKIPDKYREYMRELIQHAQAANTPGSPNPQASALQAMAVNKTMYRKLIADAAYQNQIAVDLFKSATTPDIDSINQNSRLLHRKVNYIKDKKSSKAYDTETINATGYSPVELLIAKTNQYFRGSQLESRELSQFQDFFKGVEYTNHQRLQATLAKKDFDTAFNAATRFSKRRETEKGPSVELQLGDGKKLDVSNLLDAKHPEIWNANSIRVKVIPLDLERISSSKPHKYAVYAQINGQVDKDGEPKFSKLGNISKEQEFNFVKETGIKLGEVVNVKSHEIQSGLSEGQVKLLYNQAYEVARNFYESIPEEEKQSMAAATWAVSTTRESTPKSSEISEVQQEVERVKKVSNFVFAAFENEVIQRTEELQFESAKVTKFDKNSDVFQQENTEIRYNIDSNGQDIIEVKNESGEYETFANLEAQAGRLPIGTTATAAVKYNEIYTATITTQIPGKPPVTFEVGELIKYKLGQQTFNGEEHQLEIKCIDRSQEDYVIYHGKDSKGKDIKVGRINDESVEEGIKQGWLQRAPGQGQNLKLKLTQIVSGQNGYAVGQTPDGNMVRIDLDKDFKKGNINDTDYRSVTMKAHGVSNVYMATINGETLGKIGVLPRTDKNLPKALKTLLDAGIVKKDEKVVIIPVTIQSNQSTATIALDKETIKYPDEWVKRHQLLNTAEKELTQQEKTGNKILSEVNNRPTMLFQNNEQKLAGKIGLVVDENRAENTKFFLSQKGVEYEEIPRSQAKMEAKKGMVVLTIDELTISKKMMDIFLERANGVIKSNDTPEQNIPIVAEQTVYFIDSNQEYDTNKKGAVGFVVPNKDVDTMQQWLETRGAEVNCVENGNTTVVLATAESVNTRTADELNAILGSPIDVSKVEGFDKYEADSQKLSEAVKSQEAIVSKPSVQYSEYQTALRQLPTRPKELQEEILPLPFAPAAPLEDEGVRVRQPNNTTNVPPQTPPQVILSDDTPNRVVAPPQAKELYRLIQNEGLNLPPGSIGIENAASLDNSPIRPGIKVNAKEHLWLDYNESTIVAVDFREVETVRNLLYEKGIQFDEAVGMNYEVNGVDSLTKTLKNKGYYTFVIESQNVSSQDLSDIEEAASVQYQLDVNNEDLMEGTNVEDLLTGLPDANKNVKTAITQYIENSDLFLNEWYKHIQSQPEQYVSIVNEVKNIIKIEEESSQSLDGKKLAVAAQLKAKAIEKYGEKSYQILESKANELIEKDNYFLTNPPTVIKFKGLHDNTTKQNHGGIEIIPRDSEIVKLSQSLGEGTSQQAEYQALIVGLTKAKEMGMAEIKIVSDSQNTIFQLQSKYQVKNEGLKPLYNEVKELLTSFNKVEFEKVSRRDNESANLLARSGIQQVKVVQAKAKVAEKVVQVSEKSTLNNQQKEALDKMIAFIQQPKSGSSKDNEFLLTGYAGTGKTYVIQQLLKTLEESGQRVKMCFTAPTNAAVKVLRKMSEEQGLNVDNSTTYSLLGLKEKYNQTTGEVFYDNDKRERNNKYLQYDTIVIDEGSMVNKQLRGKLEEVARKGVKVIYMGDRAQLPPVQEDESLVFQIENSAELTQVMRYSGDVAKITESIRNDITNANPAPIVSSEDGSVVSLNKEQFKEEIIKLFKSEEFQEDNSSVKVLAYTNKRVDQINAFIKEELFGKNAPEYVAGMRLIARTPVVEETLEGAKILLRNSDEMTVTQAAKFEENGYKVWQLTGITEDDKEITFKTIAEESKDKFAKDVQKLFAIENSKDPQERDYPMVYAFKEQYSNVRPAYAITVHNSQGKTITKGGVDERDINTRLSMALKEADPKERARGIKEHNQLRYVAMSRFKEKILVLGNQQERSVDVGTGIDDKLARARAALGNDNGGKQQEQQSPPKDTQPGQQEWARYAPKGRGYEVSTTGDSRFSALNARLQDGRTIEEAYQLDVKGYRSQGNDWHLGKGKDPLTPMTRDEQYQQYKDLWKQWADENPRLIDELAYMAKGKVLTDNFASTEISQARALAEILNERATVQVITNDSYTPEAIVLPNSTSAEQKVPIEIMGTISPNKVNELRQHLEANYPQVLESDKSNYAPGRQVAWVGAKWELGSKEFSPGVQDDKLMHLVKQVYPEADIALITYSAQAGQGIGYHRDDSYAANEARSINIGASEWGYQAAKTGMKQTRDENANAQVQEFKLGEGTVTRFNSKNAHAALNTDAGRWSINIWSVKQDLENLQTGKESVRQKFNDFVQSNQPPRAVVNSDKDLTLKNGEWSPGGKIEVQRTYASIQEATTAQIIRLGNNTQQAASSLNIPDNPKISGKPVLMSWDLTNPDPSLSATTTIDAMRGKGRVHSTRSEDYYKKYGIKEGDIALAQGKDGSQIAFRVGKQYKVTPEMVNNPDYQRAWVNWEKHDVKELTGRQASKIEEGRPLYGLFMEPLGDYAGGKIVPFAQQGQAVVAESLVINPTAAVAGLGAVLSNATDLAKQLGLLKENYQVSVNGNPEAPAGKYGLETHEFKPTGVPYNSAEHAFEHQLQVTPDKDPYKIMVEVLQAKLEQHPRITKTIAIKGGINYLENAQITNEYDKQWEGKGKDSKFIRALSEAYTSVIEKSQAASIPAKTTNPLAQLKPLNERVAIHMLKDIAMAEVATQFIGKSSTPPEKESSTRNYEAVWSNIGLANTGKYSKNDTVMVSGSGPWRGVTPEQISQTFESHYKPLLDKAIAANAKIVFGNADGADKLVHKYLEGKGYELKWNDEGYYESGANEKAVANVSTPLPAPTVVITPPAAAVPPKVDTSPKTDKPPVVNADESIVLKGIAPGVIISARSSSLLGAALTSTTVKSKQIGSIDKDYPISFRDNAAIAKGSYGPETYTSDKPAGQPFASVEQAYYVYKESVENLGESRVNLLAEIQQARFEQHPDLLEKVKENGGVEWLKECTYKVGSKNDFWEGKGEESPYIRSLIKGYEKVIQINNENSTSAPSASKEVIAPPREVPKETPREAPREAPKDALADKPNAPSSGQGQESGSKQNIPAFGSMDNVIERARASTLDMLSNWQQIAQKLGKDEEYLKRIDEVIETYKNEGTGIENSFLAMTEDMKEVQKLNDVTRMVQRIANTVGKMDNNNVLSAKTIDGYEFVIASSDKNLLVRDKPENGNEILLYIKEGQVKVNQVNDNFVKNLRMINFTIDNALSDVKSQLVV